MIKILVFGPLLLLYLSYTSNLHVAAQFTDPKEVKALQATRKSLNDPMKYLRNWNEGDPCTSNWTGVLCNMTESDGYLHVRELDLLNKNLSGTLSPELGQFSYMENLDFMWNKISGTIPKEIGNLKSLKLLLLNGNQLTGVLPEELGYLPNLERLQIDENQISGPLPNSYANLKKLICFHMNNNSISGQIPPDFSKLHNLFHLLLDNNNLSGYLPPQLSELPYLTRLQLDNNHFDGTIPASYGNMSFLWKLSLRNCSLQGPVPDLSRIPELHYLDLSWNQLNGSIPSNKLSDKITTIDLSYNHLSGDIPANFSGLPHLQKLSLENNTLSGDVPSKIWRNRSLNLNDSILLDFQNNMLSNISSPLERQTNVSIRLQGNPVCSSADQLNIVQFCGSQTRREDVTERLSDSPMTCPSQSCPEHYEYVPDSPVPCFCAAPIRVECRMKSPGFFKFLPYNNDFEVYLCTSLKLYPYQLYVDSIMWEAGPRLRMYLKLFPEFNNHSQIFNESEIRRIRSMFTGWMIPESGLFGPRELLDFMEPFVDGFLDFPKSGINKGALAGIVLAAIACSVTLTAVVLIIVMRRHFNKQYQYAVSRKRRSSMSLVKVDGVKGFTFREMVLATNNFNSSAEVGQGGYGKVYKGILPDGSIVAIKRAQEGSLQGEKEFFTEIELLSRVHHRNLVSLVGYCDEEDEQMLVYEFMSNGTLRDHLSASAKIPLSFAMRLRIALGSAKGVLYLHTEANPPIFHRDIKASNILLDARLTAKVADFGLSKLAPVPDIEGIVPGHVSTVVKGTPGYLDPEYFLTHQLTDKSDVYSLGVVFLELLTGMQPISHGKNIVREVNMAYQSGIIFSVIDGDMGSYPSECVEKFMTLALRCCQDDTDSRPSMAELVRELENIWVMMPKSDTRVSESIVTYPEKQGTPQYSSSTMKNPYMSSDISGGDLVSGVVLSIAPR